MSSTIPRDTHTQDHRSSRTGPTDDSASPRPSMTPTTTKARPNTCGSYLMTPARARTSPWVKDTQYSQSNYAHDLATALSPPLTPFNNVSSSSDNHTSSSSTRPYNNWETLSLKERCCSFDTSLKSSKKPDKKSSKPAPKFDTLLRVVVTCIAKPRLQGRRSGLREIEVGYSPRIGFHK